MAKKRKQKKNKKVNSLKETMSDKRIPKVIAILVMLLAVYLTIAFVSYLYTWKTDQDQVFSFAWNMLLDQEVVVENWLGRFGAIASNLFFYWGVGLPSFIAVFVLVKLAYLLFTEKSLWGLVSPLQYALTFVLFFSPLLAFIFSSSPFPWGGAFGNYMSAWIVKFVGSLGTGLLFLFLGFAFGIWNFHHAINRTTFSFKWPKIPFSKLVLSSSKSAAQETHIDDDEFDIIDQQAPKSQPNAVSAETSMDHELVFDLPQKKEAKKSDALTPATAELEINETEIFPPTTSVPEPPLESVPPVKERETPELIVEKENKVHLEPFDPTMALSQYERPRVSLLNDYTVDNVQINREELEQNKDQIINTLLHYKIEITKIRATIGPTVTLYEIVPAPGVRISKIKNLEDDIALSLAALGIRIIAPIPGKGTIGIEVPNKNKQIVGLKELLQSDKFKHAKMDLPIALGKTIANEVFIADLAKMPHLLIAGATGQGKSVGINTILMSLLYKKHPSQVKLVLIDPKKVELFPYRKLEKHFLAFLPDQDEPIITETKKVVYTLNSLCIEMDQRYDLLKKAHARNIKEYNKKYIARQLNPDKGAQISALHCTRRR